MIELHACRGFDSNGRPIEIEVPNIEKPSLKGLDENAQKAVTAQYDSELAEARLMRAKERLQIFKNHSKILPHFLHMHLKKVHCWNRTKDKDLNIVGILVGLQGGRERYTVRINVTDKDGKVKSVRRGFKNVSPVLPEGVDQVSILPLRKATDVEKEADKKLLEDKRATLLLPTGYNDALMNAKDKKFRHHTVMVWNEDGKQLAFFASPVFNDDGQYQWVSVEQSMGGYLTIHNSVIAMKGSVEELMRTTVKVNQDSVDKMLFVSIKEDNFAELATFLEVMELIAIEGTDSGKGQEQK